MEVEFWKYRLTWSQWYGRVSVGGPFTSNYQYMAAMEISAIFLPSIYFQNHVGPHPIIMNDQLEHQLYDLERSWCKENAFDLRSMWRWNQKAREFDFNFMTIGPWPIAIRLPQASSSVISSKVWVTTVYIDVTYISDRTAPIDPAPQSVNFIPPSYS